MEDLRAELRELTFKMGKFTTDNNLTMDENFRVVEVYLLLLKACQIMNRGGKDVSKS